jgi:hypothetical protein
MSEVREAVAEALRNWALMYPIPAWGLAQRGQAEKLAENWARVASGMVVEALAGWEMLSPEQAAAKATFDTAVNWMANRLDLDEVDQFQALADGLITEDEVGELSMDEIRARLDAAAGTSA